MGADQRVAEALLLRVRATNPSARTVQIASAFVEVFGDRVGDNELDVETFEESVTAALDCYEGMVGRFFVGRTSERVFVARIFSSQALEPGETIKAERLFYLPRDQYDQLQALAFALSGPSAHAVKIGHRLNKDVIEWKLVKEKGREYLWGSREFNQVASEEQLCKSTSEQGESQSSVCTESRIRSVAPRSGGSQIS